MRVPAIPTTLVAAILVMAVQAPAAPPAARDPAATATQSSPGGSPLPEDLPVRRRAAPASDPAPASNPLRDASAPPVAPRATSAPAATEAPATDAKAPGERKPACGKEGCTRCQPQVPTCKPKWEDKKTKKATFSMTCDYECVRPWEPYHQGDCCEEKTTPCGDVHVKKKLFKTEEERVERVLKYEVVMKPAPPCCPDEPECGCLGCRYLGSTFSRLFSWCH